MGQEVRVILSVGSVDERRVGEPDLVGESVDVVETADAGAEETEEVGGFGPELLAVLEGGQEEQVGLDDVFADFVLGESGRHGGEVVVTVEAFADGGFLALKQLVIEALFQLILGLIVEAD